MGVSERLNTDRLILRHFARADAPRVQEFCGNWNVASMLAKVPHPYPDGAAKEWIATHIAARANRTGFQFAIEHDAELIGAMTLEASTSPDAMVLGYWIGEPFWGKGFATEAGRRIARFAFQELDLALLHAGYQMVNQNSGKVLYKLGFRDTGQEMQLSLARGCEVATVTMELTRQEAGF
jgi:RimJ/RimL family protein N-acetyltransferase